MLSLPTICLQLMYVLEVSAVLCQSAKSQVLRIPKRLIFCNASIFLFFCVLFPSAGSGICLVGEQQLKVLLLFCW